MAEILIAPDAASFDTLETLLRMHLATIADIGAGKKFTREGKDVTREILLRCQREVRQCNQVKAALTKMGEGELNHAAQLLREIKEYLPGGYTKS